MTSSKKVTDRLFWVAMIGMGIYLLYAKGLILANYESVSPKVAYEMIKNDDNLTLLDVRTPDEFNKEGRIAGAKLIPLYNLEGNLKMLDKSKQVLVYCHSGNRSVSASRILSKNGYVVFNMSGGISSWKSEKLPVEN